MRVCQVNLQGHFGGGEVYTAVVCRALDRLGVESCLFAHPRARYWEQMVIPESTRIIRADSPEGIAARLPGGKAIILGHGPLPRAVLDARAQGRRHMAIAHMPLQGRDPRSFDGHERVFAVSGWVLEGLLAAGVPAWPEPLYGVADLSWRPSVTEIRKRSRYDWDRRKLRDRLAGWVEPLVAPFLPRPLFARRTGLSLGVVSRLTPIKQFPHLFAILAPVLTRFPGVHLEIFGSGGYRSVRDLERALAPLGERVRFWGEQPDVRAVYAHLDYLLAGLPEKEALGLNVIEAQFCDLPVLAVGAPPFTETVSEGITGFLYRDPREDRGADFARLIERVLAMPDRLHPARAEEHLARFSFDAFTERIRRVLDAAQREFDAEAA